MLRLVSYCTPSHEQMCERFVMSRAWGFDDRRVTRFSQTCPSGEFKSSGWNDCMLDKLRTLMALPTDGVTTLYVDADVSLMPGLAAWCDGASGSLADDTVAFSDDVAQWCAGIMLFKSTPRVSSFWRTLADLAVAWNVPDQDALHSLRMQSHHQSGRLPIDVALLPPDRFCNWATVSAPAIPPPWTGEAFAVPETCLAWHANWTLGIENKLAMLNRVVLSET